MRPVILYVSALLTGTHARYGDDVIRSTNGSSRTNGLVNDRLGEFSESGGLGKPGGFSEFGEPGGLGKPGRLKPKPVLRRPGKKTADRKVRFYKGQLNSTGVPTATDRIVYFNQNDPANHLNRAQTGITASANRRSSDCPRPARRESHPRTSGRSSYRSDYSQRSSNSDWGQKFSNSDYSRWHQGLGTDRSSKSQDPTFFSASSATIRRPLRSGTANYSQRDRTRILTNPDHHPPPRRPTTLRHPTRSGTKKFCNCNTNGGCNTCHRPDAISKGTERVMYIMAAILTFIAVSICVYIILVSSLLV